MTTKLRLLALALALAAPPFTLAGCDHPAAADATSANEPEHPDRWADPPVGEHIHLSDAEWKKKLSPDEYAVMRKQATEPAFSGRWVNNHEKGVYRCAACGAPLFESDTKFESGTGWPSFFKPLEGRVASNKDTSFGMDRDEIHCARCGAHLGHVFDDGPAPTGLRYCINSVSLDFDAAKNHQGKDAPGHHAHAGHAGHAEHGKKASGE